MTALGKPVVFHLKYMAEMNRLDGHAESEKPDLTGLDDPEHVLEMARALGATADEQVADFLELCGKGIEDHFVGLGIVTLTNKRRRAGVVSKWSWAAEVRVSSVPNGSFWCGVWVTAPPEIRISLDKGVSGVAIPWLWSRGGRRGEDAVWKILGGWPDSRAVEGLMEESGTVALARIPINAQPPESFDVDRDELIAEVMKPIARIGAEQMTAIARFDAGLNEPDEG